MAAGNSTAAGGQGGDAFITAGDAEAEDLDGEPEGPGHTIRLPLPTFVGDRHTNARFTEGAAGLRLLLEGEAAGVGNGLMDAQPEWHNTTKALTRAPRRLLTGADVATVLPPIGLRPNPEPTASRGHKRQTPHLARR